MRKLQEKDVLLLRQKRKITDLNGNRLKPYIKQTPKTVISAEERQAKALGNVASEITKVLQSNDKSTMMLLEMIRKIKTEIILEFPKPVKKWKFSITRNRDGFIEKLTAERA